ncbi:hypothetical protein OG21DRAFT_1128796 [Imleria badia]|nr:hypothetical protein OG21DRAFT_1128796 [Imleria badia]
MTDPPRQSCCSRMCPCPGTSRLRATSAGSQKSRSSRGNRACVASLQPATYFRPIKTLECHRRAHWHDQNTSSVNSSAAKRSLDSVFSQGKPGFEKMANADRQMIANAIRSGGLANRKAKITREALIAVKKKHERYYLVAPGVTDESALQELVSFNAVGPKRRFVLDGRRSRWTRMCFSCRNCWDGSRRPRIVLVRRRIWSSIFHLSSNMVYM